MVKPVPIEDRVKTQPYVVVGCIIGKDNKYVLVQEMQAPVRGKWNQPAGWVDTGEKIVAAAQREAEEETGLKIKITGLLGVFNLITAPDEIATRHAVKFIFAAEALTDKISFDPEEIMAARWFSLEEIKQLGDDLRDPDIIKEIEAFESGKTYPVNIVDHYTIR
jgi:8-oxo-dGTP diphosphatase